jgi:DNA-binding NarL/FixJ family response regulator
VQDFVTGFRRDAGDARTRIFIVDDHPLVRESLRLLLGREADLTICGEAATANAALLHAPLCEPDVVLIDVTLPDMSGIALAGELHRRNPRMILAMLSGHDEKLHVDAAFRAGARGYIVKGGVAELADAVRRLVDGEEYRSAELTRRPVRPVPAQCRPTFRATSGAPDRGAWDGCAPPAFSGRPRAPRHRR